MNKKLRVLHVVVQPVLVWDDGEELTPFEQQAQPIQVPLSALDGLADKLKVELSQLQEQIKQPIENPFFAKNEEGTVSPV